MEKKVKKLDFGFFKIEKTSIVKPETRFIKIEEIPVKKPQNKDSKLIIIEKRSKPFNPTIESKTFILPDSLQKIAEEKPKEEVRLYKPRKFSIILNEVKTLFANIIFFNSAIIGLIIFLASYIVFTILGITPWYAVFLSLAYIAYYVYKFTKENPYKKVEKRFPNLNEKLRTSVDSIYTENPVVDELRQEITRDISQVDYASFFNQKKTSRKIFVIILLCFLVILLGQFHFDFKLNLENRILGFVNETGGKTTGLISDIISATSEGDDSEIYGEENLAKLGNKQTAIQLNRFGNEVNVNDIKEPPLEEFEDSPFPTDVGLEQSEVYNKNIMKEYQELVKNYFQNMAKD